MTRSTNMEHVEVLRDLSEVCRAAIKAGDWKVDGACDPDAALRRADAAIASLSAPQAGEWRVIDDGWRLQSSNFGADAVLALSGDFATPGDRYAYAEAIAAKLNAPQPPAEAQPVALDYVPVKRSDLLRWAEDFARDNDPGDDTDVVTPFDAYLLQPFADEFSHDLRALAQQPAAVDAPNVWRAAFLAERAARYREGGMKIEQARIHAETDAARIDVLAAQHQETKP